MKKYLNDIVLISTFIAIIIVIIQFDFLKNSIGHGMFTFIFGMLAFGSHLFLWTIFFTIILLIITKIFIIIKKNKTKN